MNRPLILLSVLLGVSAAGCVSVDVKPIHITVDVNVKVDKALDDIFGDLDKKDPSMKTAMK